MDIGCQIGFGVNAHQVMRLLHKVEELARTTALAKLGPDNSGELAALPLSELLIVLGNWRDFNHSDGFFSRFQAV